MNLKYNTIISGLFTILSTWVIFAAMPFLRLEGTYPQIDTQVMALHFLCGIMFFYFSILLYLNKYNVEQLKHPLIAIPFLLAIFGLVTSLLNQNPNISLSGSPQIGQGVFWYFDLTIMSIIFSQIMLIKKIRLSIFINLIFITVFVTFFTFFPNWKGLPISFYYFTDYLCFYGVLCFILLTTLSNKIYINIAGFIILGVYFSFLENRAANLFWVTTFIAVLFYYVLNLFKKNHLINQLKSFLFSNGMFVFLICLISLLILFCSIYFWSENYFLPSDIKGTFLDAPIVRGKIMETSLYSLLNIKNLIFGNGWGIVHELLLENMNKWHYDELRLGYNLHFHTHNEIAEHLVSLGLVGGILFIIYLYFIFRESSKISFPAKIGWLLFFKINCFWFLWTGTLTVFAVVVSCFITYNFYFTRKPNIFNYKRFYRLFLSFSTMSIGFFLFYGAFLTYNSTKNFDILNYTNIVKSIKDNKNSLKKECLNSYNDIQRGAFQLDKFLSGYSAFVLDLSFEELDVQSLEVLNELQCKANKLIESNNFTSTLLATAIKIDADYFYKFRNMDDKKDYYDKFKNLDDKGFILSDYEKWLYKANIMAETMPNRGDLLLPFLAHALDNNKTNDAVKICQKKIIGIESFCYLVQANNILTNTLIDNTKIRESIKLINKAIEKGIFNEIAHGYWFGKCEKGYKVFCASGARGIPLSPDVLFIISDREKQELENIIK